MKKAKCIAVALLMGGCASQELPHDEGRYTSSEVALQNLNAQISGLMSFEMNREDYRDSTGFLMGLLDSRVRITGSVDDFSTIESLVSKNDAPDCAVAGHFVGKHLFEDGIELAEQAGCDDVAFAGKLGIGQFPEANIVISDTSTMSQLVLAAAYAAGTGAYQEADDYLQQAEEQYRDVSPLPIAWMRFQRGVMWAERAGDGEQGEYFYRQALDLVPTYYVANVHLAEMEVEAGNEEKALQRLESVAGSADPEAKSRLAQFTNSPTLFQEVYDLYQPLMASYPEAFRNHYLEYLLGAERYEEAYSEAVKLFAQRRDDRSVGLVMEAFAETNNIQQLCEILEQDYSMTSVVRETKIEEYRMLCN